MFSQYSTTFTNGKGPSSDRAALQNDCIHIQSVVQVKLVQAWKDPSAMDHRIWLLVSAMCVVALPSNAAWNLQWYSISYANTSIEEHDVFI